MASRLLGIYQFFLNLIYVTIGNRILKKNRFPRSKPKFMRKLPYSSLIRIKKKV